ncbi:MAG: hypothetical protein CVV64_15700 [Candidatus Wallbacteria bacterium HGW-Wallbacteria-1]|jgi:hypothetical protein|uniref:STAS/SEC14 domain-containing protein n=1 Tax=Candidatus Wallbacteria bacterium HGW-Wallbacteria-1 TaxID=2013854 RepID=A0A2N1PLF2_9BACT|nr:MAG: hypothetical protein CVV64_15700 [Candidatus Wallbacteria bacterium HGW-Wallbacteria-1]
MPITSIFNPDTNTVIHQAFGDISSEDIKCALTNFYTENPMRHSLWDLRNARLDRLTSEEVAILATFVNAISKDRKGFRTAWVAPEDLKFGLCRMSQHMSGDTLFEKRVFRTMDDALIWIQKSSSAESSSSQSSDHSPCTPAR